MCSINIRILCAVRLKLNVIKYVKEHSSSAAEIHFHPSPTKKMICEGKRQKKMMMMRRRRRSRRWGGRGAGAGGSRGGGGEE